MTDNGHAPFSRRQTLALAGLAAAATGLFSTARAEEGQADFLFVQTAGAMRYDAASGRVMLDNVSPVTLFFSDRPERIAGNMSTARFVPFWSTGTDSFLSDPPNADISMIIDGALQQSVVTLSDPVLDGTTLSYAAKPVSGEIPAAGTEVSVFIDVIGMPLTPVSYAGVARRTYRRAVM